MGKINIGDIERDLRIVDDDVVSVSFNLKRRMVSGGGGNDNRPSFKQSEEVLKFTFSSSSVTTKS